ncbi:MAG: 4-hydroxythreonine-4-phosphate dehydrogenase PdxA [Paludibacteraceae bacterium]|nr:4-hydroxythreonine-4-phosphate dehydrogenase PdxA [Paludibacteraceae bacterium]
MIDDKIVVGITQGDINGVGYEVIIKTLVDTRINEMCVPIVYGSSKVASFHRKALGIENFSLNVINSAEEANSKRSNIINCIQDEIKVELSKQTEEAGEASILALEKATEDLKNGLIDVLVTAPINKKNIKAEKFNFPGHTEYLAEKFSNGNKGIMLMVSDRLRVAVVSAHVPISELSKAISKESIMAKLKILRDTMIRDFGVVRPRIAVLGLNPHAGDNGLIGNEEQDIIIPAIKDATSEGILAFGPYPADGFFGAGNYKNFDAVLAMYHDQGLTPFKAIAQDSGVSFTAGLPIIRTSPIHGTAYDKAGVGETCEDSFRNALYLAIDVYNNRKNYAEMTANPLV